MDSGGLAAGPMGLNLAAFREPRGVMRILQFIFAICAFATICDYTGTISLEICEPKKSLAVPFYYPFQLDHYDPVKIDCSPSPTPSGTSSPSAAVEFYLTGDFSSDAQFFVASGVLAFLYCIGIVAVYALFENKYQNNSMWPLADFLLTTILAVLWLASSAAWANGLSGLKGVTDEAYLKTVCKGSCSYVRTSSYSGLNISVILGFLNFFLWASDLWFLYKETHWFKLNQEAGAGGV